MSMTAQPKAWRLAWILLGIFAVTEAVATVLFWMYFVQPGTTALPVNHATAAVLIGCASLWSYVVFGFILFRLRRATSI